MARKRFSTPSSSLGSWERMSNSIQTLAGMALTEVPPPTTLAEYVVFGWAGVWIL